jgi:glycosyltransferase involved in cell wall biosynthesis
MNEKYTNLSYICEINLPSKSAQAIHIAKMCDAFSSINYKVTLYLPFTDSGYQEIKKTYNLKNQFIIKNIFKKKTKLNFFNKIKFILQILKKQKLYFDSLIITRSPITSITLSSFGIENILELHHELIGLTYIYYKICKYLGFTKKIKFIFLHYNLVKKFDLVNNKYICLNDAVDINDFDLENYSVPKSQNKCIYIGSFYQGKGIELIYKIAKKSPDIDFDLYGNIETLTMKYHLKNIRFKGQLNYAEIPKILNNYRVALMPYQSKVSVTSSNNIDVSKSMSPLKMFDYLASGKIIIASKLGVYRHILEDQYNCYLVDPTDVDKWQKTLINVMNNNVEDKKISNNAIKTAEIFTWNKRAKLIKNFFSN